MSTGPDRLSAVRLPLGPGEPIDPFELAGSTGTVFDADGTSRVGLGSAVTIDLPQGLDSPSDLARVSAHLAAMACTDRFEPSATGPSAGVMAFASLPFDRSAPATLVVPEVVYGREDAGAEWITVVGDRADEVSAFPGGARAWLHRASTGGGPEQARVTGMVRAHDPSAARPVTGPPRVVPRSSDGSFLDMVGQVLAAIRRGEVDKVVVARHVDVFTGTPVDGPELLRRWRRLEPNCTVFSIPTPAGQFMGASPELLVERSGRLIHSRPLAGTAERYAGSGGSALPGELLESRKDSVEHRRVVDGIEAALRPLCEELDVPSGPELVHLSTIVHLGTSIRGLLRVRPDGTSPSALEVIGALHPTPAVGGVPMEAALALIDSLEPEPRGPYAGAVGYVDARGDGRWMLGIRALTVEGPGARLSAGVGIVEGSDPATELVETNLKLTAILRALAPGLADTWWEGTGQRSVVG